MSCNKIPGYAGKFLIVDLSTDKISDVVFEENFLRKYLGGTGIGVKILYDEVTPESSWFDPMNRVIIASGPLGGTSVGGSGTISLVTKGALTGGATSVQANGLFGAYLRFSGYDGVVVHGAANEWKYLVIRNGGAELRDASEIIGLDTYETCDALRNEFGVKGRNASILSIGPAGESQVRYAGVFVDHGHSASHNGPGAVLGSKKLKAMIAFRGSANIEVNNPEMLMKISQKMYDDVNYFKGTVGLVETFHKANTGTLPIKNYSTNLWDISGEKIDTFGEAHLRKYYQKSREPCWGCRLLHCAMFDVKEGPYAGVIEEPEYEQLAAWGPCIDNDDVEAAMMLSCLTDRLGFENNEIGWIISWLMECFENGWITTEQTEGFEIGWGDIDGTVEIMKMIAHRKSFGDILADGIVKASEVISGPASKAAIYTIKGNTPRAHDHRTRWAEMFDTCVSSTGTIETHMSLLGPDVQGPKNPLKISTEVAQTKGLMQLEDSVGTCRFNTQMNLKNISDAISAATGWDFTPDEGKKVGLRSINLMKVFNLRAGLGREHDYPSIRYGSTPVDGPTANISILSYWEEMLRNYYTLMGWDPETSIPLQQTLEGLGLAYVYKDIKEL